MPTTRRAADPFSTCPSLMRVEAAARELALLFRDSDPILAALTLRKAASILDEGRGGTAPATAKSVTRGAATPLDRRHRVAL